jgi:hypothetical protein
LGASVTGTTFSVALSDILCVYMAFFTREINVGGEDLYQWWGMSQWAGRPKQDTEDG